MNFLAPVGITFWAFVAIKVTSIPDCFNSARPFECFRVCVRWRSQEPR